MCLGENLFLGKGIKKYSWQLQNSHTDVKYSMGNIADNIVVTVYDAMWKVYY